MYNDFQNKCPCFEPLQRLGTRVYLILFIYLFFQNNRPFSGISYVVVTYCYLFFLSGRCFRYPVECVMFIKGYLNEDLSGNQLFFRFTEPTVWEILLNFELELVFPIWF